MPKPQSASPKTNKLKPEFEKIKIDNRVIASIELSKSRKSYPDYFKR